MVGYAVSDALISCGLSMHFSKLINCYHDDDDPDDVAAARGVARREVTHAHLARGNVRRHVVEHARACWQPCQCIMLSAVAPSARGAS